MRCVGGHPCGGKGRISHCLESICGRNVCFADIHLLLVDWMLSLGELAAEFSGCPSGIRVTCLHSNGQHVDHV